MSREIEYLEQAKEDIELLNSAGNGRVDFTVGSALDIFGGTLPYKNMLVWRN